MSSEQRIANSERRVKYAAEDHKIHTVNYPEYPFHTNTHQEQGKAPQISSNPVSLCGKQTFREN